jgi:hypothetical protein
MPSPAAPSHHNELEVRRQYAAAWASGLALLLGTLIVCNAHVYADSNSSISILETSLSSVSRSSALQYLQEHSAQNAELSHALSNLAMLKEKYNPHAAGKNVLAIAQEEEYAFANEEAREHEKIDELKEKLAKEEIHGHGHKKQVLTKWQHLQLKAAEELKHVSLDEKVAFFHSKKLAEKKEEEAVAQQRHRDDAIIVKEVI